jgi:hypothetical protein
MGQRSIVINRAANHVSLNRLGGFRNNKGEENHGNQYRKFGEGTH